MCNKTTVRHFDAQSLTWPSKSPNLSPIEHMWDALGNRTRNHRVQPRARQELEIVLHVEFLTIQDSTLHINNEEMLPSMHRAAKGGHLRY